MLMKYRRIFLILRVYKGSEAIDMKIFPYNKNVRCCCNDTHREKFCRYNILHLTDNFVETKLFIVPFSWNSLCVWATILRLPLVKNAQCRGSHECKTFLIANTQWWWRVEGQVYSYPKIMMWWCRNLVVANRWKAHFSSLALFLVLYEKLAK